MPRGPRPLDRIGSAVRRRRSQRRAPTRPPLLLQRGCNELSGHGSCGEASGVSERPGRSRGVIRRGRTPLRRDPPLKCELYAPPRSAFRLTFGHIGAGIPFERPERGGAAMAFRDRRRRKRVPSHSHGSKHMASTSIDGSDLGSRATPDGGPDSARRQTGRSSLAHFKAMNVAPGIPASRAESKGVL